MFAPPIARPQAKTSATSIGRPVLPQGSRQRGFLQAKLKVGATNDPLEHEADRIAEQVLRGPVAGIPVATAPSQLSRKCAACEEDELQRKASLAATDADLAPASVDAVLRSPGQALDPLSRAYFEPRFGHDFSGVRVHTGAAAEQSAQEVKAHAYTVGSSIVFGPGQFRPQTPAGRKLIAHELTHVLQQSGAAGIGRAEPGPGDSTGSSPEPVHAVSGTPGCAVQLQRQPAPERICVPGLAADDPACAGAKAVGAARPGADAPGIVIPLATLGSPPAGVGLKVPAHPSAVSGIHDWSSKYAVPEGQANNRNRFKIGDYNLQQISAIDPLGVARVFVYYVTGGGNTFAVGPDSLIAFVVYHGGSITARAGNSDQLDLPKGVDTRNLPAAPDAYDEEPQIVYMAPRLPEYDEVDPPPQPFRLGIYMMRPYLRRLPQGRLAVLYYIADRTMTKFGARFRQDYVVGPDWLGFFNSKVDYYAGIAELAFLTPGGESPPPEYVVRSARYVMGVIHGDRERAREGLKAWKAAAKDPSWWLQVGMGYAGAAQPTPKVGPPSLEVLPGGGARGPSPGGGVTAEPVVVASPRPTVATPTRSGGAATAAAVAEPVPAARPAITPAPAPAPRPRPQGVPGWNKTPAPVAPRVSPPSKIATGALIGAASTAGRTKAAVPGPPPAPVSLPAIGTAPNQRRQGTQTCINAELDILQAEKDQTCNAIPGDSCSPAKVSAKRLARRPCSAIRQRIAAIQDCIQIREIIQRDCFGNLPDPVHQRVMNELAQGLNACLALQAVNCAPGHPMANL